MNGWYYLHTNGELIYKPAASDPDFSSPFVRKHWAFDVSDRKDAWTVLLEALAFGGKHGESQGACSEMEL